MKNHKFMIGFEVECLSNTLNHKQIRNRLKDFVDGDWSRNAPRRHMVHVVKDFSLLRDRDDIDISFRYPNYKDVEIITPPYSEKQAIKNLKKIFMWMQVMDFKTIHTTALHVNISFKSRKLNYKIDPLSLMLNLEEESLLRKYGRYNNVYATKHKPRIFENFDRCKAKGMSDLASLRYCRKWIPKDDCYIVEKDVESKCTTVNFGKLKKKFPYLEFRLIGGQNYHKRIDEIIEDIEYFKYTMSKSLANSNRTLLRKLK